MACPNVEVKPDADEDDDTLFFTPMSSPKRPRQASSKWSCNAILRRIKGCLRTRKPRDNNNLVSNAIKKKSSNFLEDNSSSLQTLYPSKEGNFVCTMCMEAKPSALEWVDLKDCSNAYCKDCMVKLNMF
ncbi:hypothetical protein ACFX14_017817 [Malus domestica]